MLNKRMVGSDRQAQDPWSKPQSPPSRAFIGTGVGGQPLLVRRNATR